MSGDRISFSLEGREITAPPSLSIIQAVWSAGITLIEGIGCLGQGVCGSCRVFVRRQDEKEVSLMLACETLVEEGMQVSFAHFVEPPLRRRYQLEDFDDTWRVVWQVLDAFPEAVDCRHCHGCDQSCPRDIQVERAVELASSGQIMAAGRLFDACIMCNLCTFACPEFIAPNHLGQLCRRYSAAMLLRPANLVHRLVEIERGQFAIEDEALDAGGRHGA